MKQLFRYMYVVIPLFIVFSILGQMIISNQMIVYGDKLAQLKRRTTELTHQNTQLNKLLIENQSIARISFEAEKAGFIEASSYLAFSHDSFPVAIRR